MSFDLTLTLFYDKKGLKIPSSLRGKGGLILLTWLGFKSKKII